MKITHLIEAGILLTCMLPSLRADPVACTSMLTPLFNWAAQSNYYWEYPVYVTVSTHHASQGTNQTSDSVQYSNGKMTRHTNVLGGLPWFQADVLRLSSTRQFVLDPSLSSMVYVRQDGYIGIQEKIEYGKPVGGLPPTYFQGACSAGLITGASGSTAYTITFTTIPPIPVVH